MFPDVYAAESLMADHPHFLQADKQNLQVERAGTDARVEPLQLGQRVRGTEAKVAAPIPIS